MFAGTIVQVHYRESKWPPDKVAPYQIKLRSGALIYADRDSDELVKVPEPDALQRMLVVLESHLFYWQLAMVDALEAVQFGEAFASARRWDVVVCVVFMIWRWRWWRQWL